MQSVDADSASGPKFCVIVPAAGRAERFGGSEKKPFAKLDGRPIFLRTLEHFTGRPDVCQTILAVAPEDVEMVKSKYGANLGFLSIQLVAGGARRCDTVAAALQAVSPKAAFIAIHDAARPCVTSDWIDAVFAEAVKTGAAILAAPVYGTLKQVGDSMVIDKTVTRASMFEAQTPQVFRADILRTAYSRLPKIGHEVTDDAELVELSGASVSVIVSDASNIKVTTQGDIALAAAILKSRPTKAVPRLGAFEEAQW